jgi:hypothetical protein
VSSKGVERLAAGKHAAGLTRYVRGAMEQAAEQALLPRFRNLAEHERE